MNRAQVLLEYGIILAVVIAAFAAMQIFNKRAINSVIKVSTDRLCDQREVDDRPERDGITPRTNILITVDSAKTVRQSAGLKTTRIDNESITQSSVEPSTTWGGFEKEMTPREGGGPPPQ